MSLHCLLGLVGNLRITILVATLHRSGAETIFGQWGQDRERQNREREIEVFAGIGAFFVPKTSVLQQKRSSPDLKRFLVPKMAQDTGLRGSKVAQGRPKYFQGGQLPPYFPRLCFTGLQTQPSMQRNV